MQSHYQTKSWNSKWASLSKRTDTQGNYPNCTSKRDSLRSCNMKLLYFCLKIVDVVNVGDVEIVGAVVIVL